MTEREMKPLREDQTSFCVSNCYVFKSRLQEYAQKKGLPTPVYETIKEGPSHEPSFRSTVIVNDVRYDSLPGFFNRKAAEQSAAEVALTELSKSGDINKSISQPVHETGLCKNLLQEYAQKMNYAIPLYLCQKDEAPGRAPPFSCTVEIGGIRYIGAAARTKKEAEIKAARTALLAIQSSTSELSSKAVGNSQLTVIPCRKRATETASSHEETVNLPKAKKARFKKKMSKTKVSTGNNVDHSQDNATTSNSAVGVDDPMKPEWAQSDSSTPPSSETLSTEEMRNLQDSKLDNDSSEREMPSEEVALAPQVAFSSENGQLKAVNSNCGDHEAAAPDLGAPSMVYADDTALVNAADGTEVVSIVINSTASQIEASAIMPGINQVVDRIQANAGQA